MAACDRPQAPSVIRMLLATMAIVAGPAAIGGIIATRPDAVVCSVSDPTGVLPWDELVFYVSAHTHGGSTLYKTLTSDPVAPRTLWSNPRQARPVPTAGAAE